MQPLTATGCERPALTAVEGAGGPADQPGVRVFVVCEEPLMGKSLRLLLESEGFRTVHVESASRARRFCSVEATTRREVVVWVLDRIDASSAPELRVLLTASPQAGVCLLAKSIELGQLRHLLRDRPRSLAVLRRGPHTCPADLATAIREVAGGAVRIEPALLRQVLDETAAAGSDLTPAELRVLELLSSGWRNREIARRLGTTEKAVENHVRRVFAKLGLDPKLYPELDRRVTAAVLHARCAQVEPALYECDVADAYSGHPGPELIAGAYG